MVKQLGKVVKEETKKFNIQSWRGLSPSRGHERTSRGNFSTPRERPCKKKKVEGTIITAIVFIDITVFITIPITFLPLYSCPLSHKLLYPLLASLLFINDFLHLYYV